MAETAVGIDLGTSNSCVAIMRDGKVEVIPNAYGENTTASVVAFAEDGSITVGNAAKANIIHAPAYTVSSAKRLIGRYFFSEEVKKAQAICAYEIIEGPNHSVRIEVRDEEFSLPEVSAMVVREMRQVAVAKLGGDVTKAVITVPAYFNDNQRQATKDAGRIAGVEVLRILNEPTAAALAYGFGQELDQRVAVYDLGGGTFDVSVLEIGKDVFEVLATCGDTFLGGDDFDDRIIDLLADEFVAREGINPRNDPYAFEKLKFAAEQAKKGLSLEEEVEIRIPDLMAGPDGEPRSLERTITRDEFDKLVQDLILRTFKVCDEAMQQSDLTTRDLDGVILVGGPTRLPVIRDAVRDYFQQEPKSGVDPDEVVAMGAAIHAASLVDSEGTPDSVLLDVTPLDLRIGVAGGLAEPIIERNTPVPIEQSRMFTTFQDYQESVTIRVYQGDSRQATDNALLAQFEFTGFEKAKRGDVGIEVTFEIDADGIVNVTAANPNSGEQTSTRITLSGGLSESDIQSIMEQDPAGRVDTAELDSAATAAAVEEINSLGDDTGSIEFFEDDGAADDIELLDDAEDMVLETDDDFGDDIELETADDFSYDKGDDLGDDIDLMAEDVDLDDLGDISLANDDTVPPSGGPIREGPPPANPAKTVDPLAVTTPILDEPDPADRVVLAGDESADDLFDTSGADLAAEEEIELE